MQDLGQIPIWARVSAPSILLFLIFFQIRPIVLNRDGGFVEVSSTGIRVGVTAQVLSTEVVTETLITFLSSRKDARFRLVFRITSASTQIFVQYSERRIIPSVQRLREEFGALLATYHITLNYDVPIPHEKQPYRIRDISAIPSLVKLVNDLVLIQPDDLILSMDYRFRSGGCYVSGRFGASRAVRQQVRAVLTSYSTDMVLLPRSELIPNTEDIWRLLKFKPLGELPNSVDLMLPDAGEKVVGKKLLYGTEYSDLRISVDDFRMGGVISGAIGQGKTNLRLHIVDYLLRSGVKVIDFDLKGEVTRYPQLRKYATVFVPKRNFRINLFRPPHGLDDATYSEMLFTALVQSMDGDLTPPQLHLLEQATRMTVSMGGTPEDFFYNIVAVGERDKGVLDMRQDASALALITRLGWMRGSLREVFWTDENSFDDRVFSGSIFFDLSLLNQSTPLKYILLLIEMVLVRVIAGVGKRQFEAQGLRTLISMDEGQLLMPNSRTQGLSKMEEIVTTMRYRGIGVLVAGVHEEMMSQVLLDTGFNARFRSFSEESTLTTHQCSIRKESSGYRVIDAHIIRYPGVPDPHSYPEPLGDTDLPEFEFSQKVVDSVRYLLKFPQLLHIPAAQRRYVLSVLVQLDLDEYANAFRSAETPDELLNVVRSVENLVVNFLRAPHLGHFVLFFLSTQDRRTLKRFSLHSAVGELL